MPEKKHVDFDLYELDMQPDGYGGWEENQRFHIGEVSVQADENGHVEDNAVISKVAATRVRDLVGRVHNCLTTTDRRRVYVEDLYGDGSWLEVGVVKTHLPIYGLKRRYERGQA